ncbi:MAG: hypothetical protein JWM33_1857, partial [Caulobacteraceae bacterium]|nr:hypothetical protein [Caulobacteraceae bacterium]
GATRTLTQFSLAVVAGAIGFVAIVLGLPQLVARLDPFWPTSGDATNAVTDWLFVLAILASSAAAIYALYSRRNPRTTRLAMVGAGVGILTLYYLAGHLELVLARPSARPEPAIASALTLTFDPSLPPIPTFNAGIGRQRAPRLALPLTAQIPEGVTALPSRVILTQTDARGRIRHWPIRADGPLRNGPAPLTNLRLRGLSEAAARIDLDERLALYSPGQPIAVASDGATTLVPGLGACRVVEGQVLGNPVNSLTCQSATPPHCASLGPTGQPSPPPGRCAEPTIRLPTLLPGYFTTRLPILGLVGDLQVTLWRKVGEADRHVSTPAVKLGDFVRVIQPSPRAPPRPPTPPTARNGG